MRTIWKFPLPLADIVTVQMPDGAHPLTVGEQHGELFLWAHVDSDMPSIPYDFRIVGTGHGAPELGNYIGTVHTTRAGRFLVWHVFEMPPKGLL